MTWKTRALTLLLLGALVMCVAVSGDAAKLAGSKVRLGVIMPMAGIFVDWGQHGLIGAEIARDEHFTAAKAQHERGRCVLHAEIAV